MGTLGETFKPQGRVCLIRQQGSIRMHEIVLIQLNRSYLPSKLLVSDDEEI
jgi:hypothetical protein